MRTALVVGGGPAGLMAAEMLSAGGVAVTLADRMPSLGRKFLMAGKSGLNLTKDEPLDRFLAHYSEPMRHIIARFGPQEVMNWAEGLGQPLFTGSTGRVFPMAMKASPLLRAWLERLRGQGVTLRTRWRWTGWDGAVLTFDTPDGPRNERADTTILACGGASWTRLGSDGEWARLLPATAPFAPANCGFRVAWSDHMRPLFGSAVKATRLTAGELSSRGEWVIRHDGVEGGGIYEVSAAMRDGAPLVVDLLPDMEAEDLRAALSGRNTRKPLTQYLRGTLRLTPPKLSLFNELRDRGDSAPAAIACDLKALRLPVEGPQPLDRAISTAGGLRFDALDSDLMLRDRPGTYAAGEMLDWEAITGGYLLTGCLATGRHAGVAALARLNA